jgi:hypothetical protein
VCNSGTVWWNSEGEREKENDSKLLKYICKKDSITKHNKRCCIIGGGGRVRESNRGTKYSIFTDEIPS